MKKLIWLFIALMVLGYITAPSVSNSAYGTKNLLKRVWVPLAPVNFKMHGKRLMIKPLL
jgi:hypothetical protein